MIVQIGSPQHPVKLLDEAPESLLQELTQAYEDFVESSSESQERWLDWDTLLLADAYRSAEVEERQQLLDCARVEINDDILDVAGELLDHTDLPEDCKYRLKISRLGVAGSGNSRVVASWMNDQGNTISAEPTREGGVLVMPNGERFLLSLAQYRALSALDELEPSRGNRDEDRLAPEKVRSAIAELPIKEGVLFDAFLEKNFVQQIDAFEPRFEQNGDSFNILPSSEKVSTESLEQFFYRTRKEDYSKRPLKTKAADGRRVTTIVSKKAADSLVELRQHRDLSAREVARIISKPQETLGDKLDLSRFSERISGFGVEVKRSTPKFVEVKVDEWWSWEMELGLEDAQEDISSSSGVEHLDLKDATTREALRTALDQADVDESTVVPCPSGRGFIQVSQGLRESLRAAEALAAQSDEKGRVKSPPRQILQVLENLEGLVFDRSEMPDLSEPTSAYEPPPGLAEGLALHPHQVEGFQWLTTLYQARSSSGNAYRGALLADDMGVGKTLQVLAMLSQTREQNPDKPHLVVAPVSLLLNWDKEARRFFGNRFEPVHHARGPVLRGERDALIDSLSAQGIVLTSYETLRRRELIFAAVDWNVIVLDEAQKAKNPGSQISRVLRTLKACFRLAATGTPVENSLSELWSIMDWAVPGLLGSLRDFGAQYIVPLKSGEDAEKLRLAAELQETIAPVFIRRMKHELKAALPEINFHHDRFGLSDEQRGGYSRIVRNSDSNTLVKLQRLFQICQHPDFENKDSQLSPMQDKCFPRAEGLITLLDDVRAKQEKVIIFCNRILLQKWIRDEVSSRYDIPVEIINGEVSDSSRRLGIIDTFSQQSGFGVLVLATKAAGVGLNITAANHVFHYTREWNPALENQATDRAYRIGQERSVHVRYFIAQDPKGKTVDEYLSELLEKKRELMRTFVIPMGGFEITKAESQKLLEG